MGLKTTDIDFIRSTFFRYPGVKHLYIFGSRAKGNYRPNSDIDIAYVGNLSHHEFALIQTGLAYDAPFLYTCDIVDLERVHDDMRSHIERVGIEILPA